MKTYNYDRDILVSVKNKICELFQDRNLKIEIATSRNDPHIRVTKGLSHQDLDVIKKHIGNFLIKRDTRYSSSYKTIFINFESKIIPLIISDSYFKNSSDSIIQKQLCPSALGISGEYSDLSLLVFQTIDGLHNLDNKPTLNNKALEELGITDDNNDLLMKLLTKLVLVNINKVELTVQENEIYKINKSSIDKDFGEILFSLSILSNKKLLKIKSLVFREEMNSSNYDIETVNEKGKITRINIKSGAGSGQSFKAIEDHQIKSMLEEGNYIGNSIYDYYTQVIKELNGNTLGKNKIFNISNILINTKSLQDKEDSITGNILLELQKIFFNGNIFSEENITSKHYSFQEYTEIIESILEKNEISVFGIPRGTKNKTAQNVFDDLGDKFLLNALLFFIQTLIARTTNDVIITEIFTEFIQNKIKVQYIKEQDGKIILLGNLQEQYCFSY